MALNNCESRTRSKSQHSNHLRGSNLTFRITMQALQPIGYHFVVEFSNENKEETNLKKSESHMRSEIDPRSQSSPFLGKDSSTQTVTVNGLNR